MKGISPMIAAVFLIVIAVSLAGIILGWLKGFTLERQEEISNRSGALGSCAGSVISVDDVYLDFTSNKSRAAVRNSGQLTEKIISAQLLNTNGLNATMLGNKTVTLAPGGIGIIEFPMNGTIDVCANFSQVKVTTLCTSDASKKTPVNC